MNYDEFAFFNQQLAGMLRAGIPLEGALKQLAVGMRAGRLQAEIQKLEADLARGIPLKDAMAGRDLPEFYRRMLEIGVQSNDLPGVLTLLADHYHQANLLWTRLKGLMVYPLLVIVVSLALTLTLSIVFSHFLGTFFEKFSLPTMAPVVVWIPPVVLALVAAFGVASVTLPAWRERLRWRLPAFRESSLAQLASAIALMLRKGTPLADALALAEKLEDASPAAKALAGWRARVEAGQGKPAQWGVAPRPFPPLFLWLIQKGGEDAAAGFEKAAEIYRGRASYRIELALYGAMPVSILFVGQLVLWQAAPLMQAMVQLMNMLGDPGSNI
jgi:type II secretory pathway component PulF